MWWRLLFALAIASIAIGWWADHRQSEREHHEDYVAACERGNALRENQLLVIKVLSQVGRRFSRHDPDPLVRAYLVTVLPKLEVAKLQAAPVDCLHPPPHPPKR